MRIRVMVNEYGTVRYSTVMVILKLPNAYYKIIHRFS